MSITITVLDAASLAPTPEIGRFDVISVDYGPEAVATEHPVELGVEVTDHVQKKALRLVTEVFVTASPLGLGVPVPLAIDDAIGFFERALGQICTLVIDGEGTFSPMVLEAAPHTRSAVAGRGFSLRWKQIRIASAISVTIPPRMPAPVAAVGAPTEADLGECSTTEDVPTSKLLGAQLAAGGFVKATLGIP